MAEKLLRVFAQNAEQKFSESADNKMRTQYPYTSLGFVEKNIPEMESLGVSKVARSRGQFIDQYRKSGGNPNRLPEFWRRKRNGFVARHLAQYQKGERRRRLALIAWAYNPD